MMAGRVGAWARRATAWRPGVAALMAVLVLTGCQVTTTVAVKVGRSGAGTVAVMVDFDAAAVRAVGGVSGALQVSDLEASGWTVVTTPGAGGSDRVLLTHAFARTSELPAVLAEVGRAPTGAHAPLFILHVTQTKGLLTETTTARGTVDLSCGLYCFGDAGLQRTYGSELGVSAGSLRSAAGRAVAARAFPFVFDLAVPGHVTSSNAPASGAGLRWGPVLGGQTLISVTATEHDPVRVAAAAAAAAAVAGGGSTGAGIVIGAGVVIVVFLFVVGLWWRRSRRPRRRFGQRRA